MILPVSVSNTWTSLFSPARKRLPSLENATASTLSVVPVYFLISLPVSTSHSLHDRSRPLVSSCLPSGEKDRPTTNPSCALAPITSGLPVSASQMRKLLSLQPTEAILLPSGENCTFQIHPVCPSILRTSLAVSVSYSR